MPAQFAPPSKKGSKKKRKKRTCAQCDQELHVDNAGKYCSEDCKTVAREEQKRKRQEDREKNAVREEQRKTRKAAERKKAEQEAEQIQLAQNRQNAVKRLSNLFDGDEGAAKKLEKRLTKLHKGDGPGYKNHVQNIVANLKQNRALLDKVLSGEVTLKKLCNMSVEDMAPAEIAEERRRNQEEFEATRVLKQKMVLGRIINQTLATENEDLGMRDSEFDWKPETEDLGVNPALHNLHSGKAIKDGGENKQEEGDDIDIDIAIHVDDGIPDSEKAQPQPEPDQSTTKEPQDDAKMMDVDKDDELLPQLAEDSDEDMAEICGSPIPESPVGPITDSASPPPAKKRRLNSPPRTQTSPQLPTTIPRIPRIPSPPATEAPAPAPAPLSPFRIAKKEPSPPPSFPSPDINAAPEPPPSFVSEVEASPDRPRKKSNKRPYSKMENGSRSRRSKKPRLPRTDWKGTFVLSKKKSPFRVHVQRIAGSDTNYPKLIPRKISVNGRVKLEAINTSLGEFARGAHRKSQKVTSMFIVRRDSSESQSEKCGSQEAFDEMVDLFATESKGAVVDMKKDRGVKMYFLPPNLVGLDSESVVKNWNMEPPTDSLWGFLIHYRHS